jgi:hypothetical protein
MTTQTFVQHGEYGRHHNSDKWVVNLLADAIRIHPELKCDSVLIGKRGISVVLTPVSVPATF